MLEKTIQIHVYIYDTAELLVGFLQCNGGKLEEAEDFKCVFAVYCVLESKCAFVIRSCELIHNISLLELIYFLIERC